jgi:hypothetical protein
MTKIYFDDVPENLTVNQYIKSKLNWSEAVKDIGGTRLQVIKEPVRKLTNSAEILKDIYDVYRDLGAINWQSRDSCSLYGLSLTCNRNAPKDSWKRGSFGNQRYQSYDNFDYYQAVEDDKSNRLKGDYLDSLCFRSTLDEVKKKVNLFSCLDMFSVPIHRVTSRTMNGNILYPTLAGLGGMHRDENQFESLRINVCVSNNGEFGLQCIGEQATFPEAGDVNFVNTDVMHRAYIKQRCDFQRTHLIINLSPWLDFDEVNDCWSPNQFFGKAHPLDMVKQGLIFKQGKA